MAPYTTYFIAASVECSCPLRYPASRYEGMETSSSARYNITMSVAEESRNIPSRVESRKM